MKTIEELKTLLNPNGEKNGKWTYVPVEKSHSVTFSGETVVEKYIELHEVYFDENGDFIGAKEKCGAGFGQDIEDLKLGLQLMLEGADNPVITKEELTLIRNS